VYSKGKGSAEKVPPTKAKVISPIWAAPDIFVPASIAI